MFFKSQIFRVVSILTIILSLSAFVFADVIRLKDGSVLKGRITNFQNGKFTIVIGEGSRQREMKFFADEIDEVIFDSQASPAVVKTSVRGTTSTNNTPKQPSYQETSDGKNTVITVGSAPKTTNPQTTSPRVNTTSNNNPPVTTPSKSTSSSPKPIQIKVKVLADNTANGWTNAGWVVRKGQKIRIESDGRISLGNGRYSGPSGITTLPDDSKLIKDKPTGSLIAVIGDDNNDFIYIGEGKEFVAQRDGALFLGINEGALTDNTGAFEVTLEIATTIGTDD